MPQACDPSGAKGAVAHWFSDSELFEGQCGLPPRSRSVSRQFATVEALFHERAGN
jgi:hypothetical protein